VDADQSWSTQYGGLSRVQQVAPCRTMDPQALMDRLAASNRHEPTKSQFRDARTCSSASEYVAGTRHRKLSS